MKFALSALAALLIAPAALADSAFSDATGSLDNEIDISGSGDFSALDSGFSFGGWAGPTQAQVTFSSTMVSSGNIDVDADAVETINPGGDEAFADVVINGQTSLQGGFNFAGLTQDLGSGGSFADANGSFAFSFESDNFGSGNADANDF